ncbi:MAG TPA: nucleoside-diphosphate sugar epimerase [Maribacter sp.]|uniref:NAD(P)H-binding protein n=1 Tax=unclassified Maribacter TaxID=2615042 RepID=UPI000EC88918|nr:MULTISPECIES: NAD(P)H-binding protein [unclassified Maribacter]HAF76652.1 nucleoside-diphosphate sugar epimerase [Maribacter sp.]|tara:strand:+ start:294 stop:959 length:666 start_codon:yes stop_codon:yes gene_type:complete
MNKTAIILGASGLTGGLLLEKLIVDDRYESIKLFSRSSIKGLPNKVKQYIGDLLELEQFKNDFTGDEVYCCIGTTAKKTPDKSLYRDIDYGIPVAAAKLAKANRINTFLVISAMGANKKSNIFYNRTKGEMEQEVLNQAIPRTSILRPSLIGGERNEQRLLEKIGLVVFKVIQPLFIGPLKKYRIINADSIAQAMLNLANTTSNTDVIITSDDIEQLAKTT